MNRAKLKSYAPQARRDFIQEVTDRAAFYGISKSKIEPVTQQGDVGIILGRPFPKTIIQKREKLIERITGSTRLTAHSSQPSGFDQVMEAVAYTWFNRFVAIRYMELHGYLDHGYRVLSHPEGKELPEILEHATEIDFSGLNKDKVLELKLDGTRDNELYRLLLVAQCNALNKAMPFLFGRVDDESELLLPENLLHTESLIRKLVIGIDEDDWQEVEIIGWLYQFYISEKKDQVIGKVVKSEDIPAATQLFTPNWIVKYMVQNTLGRKWLATYPDSSIRGKMEFYIEPAEQESEVIEQLKKITLESLNPEEITFLDPACGSGHILVEAYELFKAIYQERGYRLRDIPELILSKNLFGLEIDDRAAQLACLSLLLKARADDRRIFERDIQPQVISIQQTNGIDAGEIFSWLMGESSERWAVSSEPGSLPFSGSQLKAHSSELRALKELIDTFQNAKTFGSLITIPQTLKSQLPKLKDFLDQRRDKDMWVQAGISLVERLIKQAETLSRVYGISVTNPPYMGSKYQIPILKTFQRENYKGFDKDVFASFVHRSIDLVHFDGFLGFVTPYVWMFISSFEEMRDEIIKRSTLATLTQLEYNAFEPACVPVCTFTFKNRYVSKYTGSYIKLTEFKGHQNQALRTLEAINNPACGWFYTAKPDDFKKIPGSPIAYWLRSNSIALFDRPNINSKFTVGSGLSTSDNERFVRFIWEVSRNNVAENIQSCKESESRDEKWYLFQKGGEFRKWHGNISYLVNWKNNGEEIKYWVTHNPKDPNTTHWSRRIFNTDLYYRKGITWSTISSGSISFRLSDNGTMISNAAGGIFGFENEIELWGLLIGLNCKIWTFLFGVLNPTLNYSAGIIQKAPIPDINLGANGEVLVDYARNDWNCFETSWEFKEFPLLKSSVHCAVRSEPESQPNQAHSSQLRAHSLLIANSYATYRQQGREMSDRMKALEEQNNRIFIEAYDLQDELSPEVPIEQITLTVNPKYRYGADIPEEELDNRFRQDTMKELISYSLGCMMGRYSLDKPGLIYAHSGNKGFDPGNYTTFPADDDGIVPITELDWFEDDAANRFIKFISVAWDKEHLEENLEFIADSLDRKKNEQPRDTIRRYFQNSFFKDHLKTYKKRPIYWLFSSGKQKAFQCLVYLHRYNEGTLSRMRTEYVIPLQGKIASRIEQLERDIPNAESTSHQNKLRKEKDVLLKHQDELLKFDEKLRHYADLRISLDLDDGVKVNYGKFGDLLAEVKAVTGSNEQ